MRTFWLAIGFGGQIVFSARFLWQWLASEKAKKSVVPIAFWWLSIAGAALLLSYAIYRKDPVFIVGQLFGFIVYTRNLYFIFKERKRLSANDAVS
ncbi:MAG TPA: lipid-A-disaccharide synthase N-terminal domain-containing protein [candidate division Zixibacteria bacterium]|jgi:lipid-A-disaccharide synthase-like uncharacterized protein|nr:lipid-A-disaccharide synthase N-terminal domain-containing protein [candidate division Zixibacteria bacterium]